MAESELKVFSTMCPAADASRAERPIPVTLYVTSINGVRAGAPDVVCPLYIKNTCVLSQTTFKKNVALRTFLAESDRTSLRWQRVSAEGLGCIQKNPS